MRVPLVDYQALVRFAARRTDALRSSRPGASRRARLYVHDGDIVLAGLRFGNVVLMIQPPRGFGENPIAIYHDPALRAVAPLPGRVPLAGRVLRRRRGRAPGQARHARVAARQGPRPVGRLRARRRARRPAADLPVHRQRPGRGHAGQAPRARGRHRPPGAADGPRRHLRRTGQARAAARRIRHRGRARPGEGAGRSRADLVDCRGRPAASRPARDRRSPATPSSTTSSCTSTATCARSRTCRSATGCTCSAARRSARRWSTWCCRSCGRPRSGAAAGTCPACAAALADWAGLDEAKLLAEPGAAVDVPALTALVDGPARTAADAIDLIEALARRLVSAARGRAAGRRRRGHARRARARARPMSSTSSSSPPPRWCRAWPRPPTS